MLDIYLKTIREEIKQKDLVKKDTILRAEKWTNSCYNQLSKIISQILSTKLSDELRLKLGTTISSKTLSNIYKGVYKLTYPIDPRTLNTLSKLVIFLDYANWEAFVSKTDKRESRKAQKASPKKQVESIVAKAINNEFKAYNALPDINKKIIEEVFIKNSSASKRVFEILHLNQQNNWVLSNTYNPSTFELLDIEVLEISEHKAKVKTKEFWRLCWWDMDSQKYVKRYKNIAEHFYVLQKEENNWMIRTNASLTDFNEVEEKKTIPSAQSV